MPLSPGTKLGQYEVVESVGAELSVSLINRYPYGT